jgi:hypothetical protein
MTGRALVTLTLALRPDVAAACATCLSSAYGDRTFNWAFLGLLLMPFVVAAVIGGVLLYRYGGLRGFLRWAGGQRIPGRSKTPRANSRVEETT